MFPEYGVFFYYRYVWGDFQGFTPHVAVEYLNASKLFVVYLFGFVFKFFYPVLHLILTSSLRGLN